MATNDNKANTGTPASGTGGTTPANADTTVSAKAAARKKSQQQQQKNQKNNPNSKKKQANAAVPRFEGVAAGVNPMKGIVIARSHGDLTGQFRVFRKKLAGAAADDKAFGLDSAILDLVAKVQTDFVEPRPDPLVHSNLIEVVDVHGLPTGERRLVCHDPILKEQMDLEYNTDLKIQKGNWNQYERHYEGFYRTAIGNVEENILTYCRTDSRMAAVETNKDLIGLLLILRSVCAQNNGGMKVDEEYRNLITIHAAISWRQDQKTDDATFAEQLKDRYGSAIHTCGKFVFGQSVYDKVLADLPTPMTFPGYILLDEASQIPIDKIVKERTIARLIIKNSLNDRAREQLSETFSVNNSTCYPNTISEAMSLLSTFKVQKKKEEVAVVSYHETTVNDIVDDVDSTTINDHNPENSIQDVNNEEDYDINNINDSIATEDEDKFDAQVMAAVIAEATAEVADDRFFGASFATLQEDVDDAFDDNEPDLVCYAHVVDHAGAASGDSDDDSRELNEGHSRPTIRKSPYVVNHKHDFETVVYLTAQRVNNPGDNVRIRHYEVNNPDLISLEYGGPTPEAIVDYSDVLRLKLQIAGIRDLADLTDIFEDCSIAEAATDIRQRMIAVCQVPLHTNTVRHLKEETYRHKAHLGYNSVRYSVMWSEIGRDDAPINFPAAHVLLSHTIIAVAAYQQRRKPTRWINKVTQKMINCGINSREQLENAISSNTLNDVFHEHGVPSFHKITIFGFKHILGMEVNQGYIAGYTQDFRYGRS